MQEQDLERLLARYRPAAPRAELAAAITGLPDPQVPRFSRTWPWAVATAALLALTVGIHAAALFTGSEEQDLLDTRRVQAVAEGLGGPENRPLAEWIVRQETRADREAQLARIDSAAPPAAPK